MVNSERVENGLQFTTTGVASTMCFDERGGITNKCSNEGGVVEEETEGHGAGSALHSASLVEQGLPSP